MQLRLVAVVFAPIVFCAQAALTETDAAPPPDLDCDAVIGSDMGFRREAQVEQWFQDLAYCHDTIEEVAEYLSGRGFGAHANVWTEGNRLGLTTLNASWNKERHGTADPFNIPFYAYENGIRWISPRVTSIVVRYETKTNKMVRFGLQGIHK